MEKSSELENISTNFTFSRGFIFTVLKEFKKEKNIKKQPDLNFC